MEQHQHQQSRLHQHHQVGTLTLLLGLVQSYIKYFCNIVIINYVQVDLEGLLVKAEPPLRKYDYLMTVMERMRAGAVHLPFEVSFIHFWSDFYEEL